jgi:hypothetical protein
VILHDFYCVNCDMRFEDYVASDVYQTVHEPCGNRAERVMSAPHVGTMNDPNARAAALRKRSHEHTMKEARSNADRLAAQMGGSARPRVQQPWNLRTQKKKSP